MKTLEHPVEAPTTDGEMMVVTAHMAEPVVYYEDGLHLDGPLSYSAYLEWCDDHDPYDLPPISGPWALDFDLPLDRWSAPKHKDDKVDARLLSADGEIWGWMCSAAHARWCNHGVHHVRKRPELESLARFSSAKSHNYGLGPLKAKNIPFPTVFAREIHWRARGDIDGVRRLLDRVSHIGKLCGQGHGAVLKWTIEKCVGLDALMSESGCLLRCLPASAAPHATHQKRSIRAPYHHRSREVFAVITGTEVL